jgi:hypothetical protein
VTDEERRYRIGIKNLSVPRRPVPYNITIRVEGGSTFDLASFVVERVGKAKLLMMRPAT